MNLWDSAACGVLSITPQDSAAGAWDTLIKPCHACCPAKFLRAMFDDGLSAYDEGHAKGQVPPYEGCLDGLTQFDWRPNTAAPAASIGSSSGGAQHATARANGHAAPAAASAGPASDADDLASHVQQAVVVSASPGTADQQIASASKAQGGKSSGGKKKGRKKADNVDTSQLD